MTAVETRGAREIEKIGGIPTIPKVAGQVRRLACCRRRRYDLASMPVGRSRTAFACEALAMLVFGALAPEAQAEKTYPIRIETTPPGATVYLEDKESDPLGRTPYDGKLEAGNHTLIIELEGFVGQVSEISVKKKSAGQKFKVKLAKIEKGTIEVMPAKAQAQVAGAKVFVDGKEEGNLPDTIKVEAGAHQVEVKKEGYRTYEEWVEVQEGETARVKVELVSADGSKLEAAASDGGNGDDDASNPTLGSGDDDPDADIEGEGDDQPIGRAIPFVAVAGGVELGGRRFRFKNPQEGNLRPYDAGGVPMIRVSVELAPLAFSSSKALNGWTLLASYARSTPLDSTATINQGQENEMPVSVPTRWSNLDLGLGYRYRFGAADASYAGLVAGYGIHTFTFDFDATNDTLENQIPDVEYKFISVGLEGRFAFAGRFAGLLSGGTRLVNATGNIGQNFLKTDVVAFGTTAGLAAGITKSIEARLVGRFDQYSHTFTPKEDNMIVAAGGTDRYFGVTLSAVFLY